MEIKNVRLINILPLKKGESKNGEWIKQDLIFETEGNYPKQICVAVWGNKIDPKFYNIGEHYHIHIEIESREYNGKWYTDVKAWKIENHIASKTELPNENNSDEEDLLKDLPF